MTDHPFDRPTYLDVLDKQREGNARMLEYQRRLELGVRPLYAMVLALIEEEMKQGSSLESVKTQD